MDKINVEELYKWIDNHTITRPKKCIHRDFSDAVPLAEILKVYYPHLVQLHNYSPKNAVNLKLINWEMLNRKVLSKINYPLDSKIMKKLAESTPGVIENLLYDIRLKIDEMERKKSNNEELLMLNSVSQSTTSILNVQVKNGTKVTMQKMVPSDVYDKMQRDIMEQDELIVMLSNKVQHLEALVSIKDERIRDLTEQLDKCINNKTKENNGNHFFKNKRFN